MNCWNSAEIERAIRQDVLLEGFWLQPGVATARVRTGEVTLEGTVETEAVALLGGSSMYLVWCPSRRR